MFFTTVDKLSKYIRMNIYMQAVNQLYIYNI